MAEKQLFGRIINKHDIEANWLKAVNFIPKKAELIVYDVDDTYSYERFKIGDGIHTVSELPFSQVQPDWDQIDETQPDFIKNKPDEVDALEVACETGLIDPVTASDGSIFVDANGAVFTLI